MKRIYILLGLATSILSTSCMEKAIERKKLFPENGYYQATNVQLTTPLPFIQNPPYMCTANQTGWEKLNDIANGSYNNNQHIIQDPTDLKPVYKTVSIKATTKREKKVALLEPIMHADDKCIKCLLSDAYEFVYSHHSAGHSADVFLKDENLISLIETIHFEHNNGIHEDLLAEAAYQEEFQLDTMSEYIALVFNCIKQYNVTIKKAQETLASTHSLNCIDIEDLAYIHLADCLQKLFRVNIDEIYAFTYCIYFKKMTFFPNSYTSVYKHLTNEFYDKAYDLLVSKKLFTSKNKNKAIQELLHMVDQAKKRKDILSESDLITQIRDFAQPIGVLSTIADVFGTHYSTHNIKNRIVFFCTLMQAYNRARGNKETPTTRQYSCYQLQRYLDLALLDSINKNQFNPELYAFAEFKQLKNETKKLIKSDDQSIQQKINTLKK